MQLLKDTIKDMEGKLYEVNLLTKVMSHDDYIIKSNHGYNTYTFTKSQQKRLDVLLGEFKQEMLDEVEPMKQKLSTLEQLLG